MWISGARRQGLPLMLQPGMGQRPLEGQQYALDNGRFNQRTWVGFSRWFKWIRSFTNPLFTVCPDVVGDAWQTRLLAQQWLPFIRLAGHPAAYVAQNGTEQTPPPWDGFECLFIGGSTEWKLSEFSFSLVREAKQRDKWVHIGRVNSYARFKRFADAGADSADGTLLAFDPNRNVYEWPDRAAAQPPLL